MRAWWITAALAAGLLAGCNSGARVGSASCSACTGGGFTPSDCERFGAMAGCETAELRSGGACTNECVFSECREPPECGTGFVPEDAPRDAFVDPRCGMPEDGIFGNCDLCGEGACNEFMYMGVTQYYCDCGPPCPCGLVCGSIPLPAGGTIGSACGPP